MFRDQKGMSLIQVMIAMGLMSVIGLGVAELMVTSSKVNQRSDIKISRLIVFNELQSIISEPEVCTSSITGNPQTFNPTQALNDGWNISFNVGGKVIQTDSEITNGLSVARLYYQRTDSTTYSSSIANSTNYLGKIIIEFDTDDDVIGGQLKSKEVGMMFLTASTDPSTLNEVLACASKPEIPIATICDDLGGEYINGKCSNFNFASCTNPTLSHGDSTTENYSSGGKNCFKSTTCIDGKNVTTTDFCETATVTPTTGTECTSGSNKTEGCSLGGTKFYTCINGYWSLTSENCVTP